MISFEKVTKKFPLGNIALDDVSFKIDDNDFVFFVGPSGAGKTTILKLILNELSPSSGSIVVDDFDITSKKFGETVSLRRKIGVVFQDFKILPDKNVFENIALSLKVTGTSIAKINEEVRKVLELVNLAKKEKVFPAQLSAGELQRVAIARAMTGNRSIILADEPTGNLDPKTSWEIMKIFKKIDGEKTVIIATHNTDIVNSLQKRVIVLKDGKLSKDLRKGGYEV
jgi:cell division transport system ATP-binding protein